ncbi:WW domain-binding protein 4 isoform X3 [Rattus norvegicus]|uniref:WW domain-binding protein 4 isoform X3 n=1 Tax=Rattus norvegicus TaxID=10116 RepID=UPI0019172E7D|nr:WW domain-binding protein 4 isoform X3 [Rattus norvegicus]
MHLQEHRPTRVLNFMKEERTTRKMWPGRSARYPWRFLLFPGNGGLFSHSCLHLCLTQIKQKSLDKAKEEEKASKEFAAMEAAALKAYQEDLKRLGLQSDISEPTISPVTNTVQPTPTANQQKEKKKKKKKKEASKGRWVEGVTADGHCYYYDLVTGASQWEKPEGFQGNLKKTAAKAIWVEGLSEDGYTYYYNTETGVIKMC